MRRHRSDADFAAEVAAHLQFETDRLVRAGMAPEEARLAARRGFGNVTAARERFHESRRAGALDRLGRDLRQAARALRRTPALCAASILTFALGIGAVTAVFGLVNGVLLRPLPFAQPERLVDLSHTLAISGLDRVDQSDATFLHYRRATRVFSGLAAYAIGAVNLGPADGSGEGTRVRAARVTRGAFATLGVAPRRGRVFGEAEDRPGAAPVVLLGERLWRARYGADPGIVGRAIPVDGVPHEVLGIMPARFTFPDAETALWIPARLDPAQTSSAVFAWRAVARLRDAVTAEAAAAELQRLLPTVPEEFPGRLTAGAIAATKMRAVVRPLRDTIVGDSGRVLWVVLGAAACLLLVACANVAGLFLVRAAGRRHDLAVRLALGAGRGAIVRQFLAEGLILAGLGGLLGLGLAVLGERLLRSLGGGGIPRLGELGLDGTVLGVAVGATLLAALFAGLAPAIRRHPAALSAMLMRSGRAATPGRERHRAQRLLVTAQVALALVLVTGAGLLARSWENLRAVRPGFDGDPVYTFRVALPAATFPAAADVTRLLDRARDAIGALPGVRTAAVVSKLPLDAEARRDTAVFLEDHPVPMGGLPAIHPISYAGPEYFATMGIPLLEGRTFDAPDPARASLDVVVSRALVNRYWPGGEALGKRLRLSPTGPWFTIVGVTGDVLGGGLDGKPEETVYLPLVTAPGPAAEGGGAGPARYVPREVAFVVRSTGAAGDLAEPLRRTLRGLSPDVPLYSAYPMADVVRRSASRTSFTLTLLGLASLAALTLGAVGIYGVISHLVTLRRREIAVRLALGARPADVRRMISRQVLGITSAGILLGLATSVLLTRFLAALLFGVARTDAATLAGAVLVLAVVAGLAGWLPARRASQIEPAGVLQGE